MDPTMKTFTSEAMDTRRWIGRLVVAVILGEAIWGLIVSVMNNLVVPWLGDVMGQSSGLPTSFTQRPYNYPDLFVSVLEFCIAGLVAAVLNYFIQGRNTKAIRTVKSSAPAAVEPARMFPQPTTTAALTQTPSPYIPAAPVMKAEPVTVQHPLQFLRLRHPRLQRNRQHLLHPRRRSRNQLPPGRCPPRPSQGLRRRNRRSRRKPSRLSRRRRKRCITTSSENLCLPMTTESTSGTAPAGTSRSGTDPGRQRAGTGPLHVSRQV